MHDNATAAASVSSTHATNPNGHNLSNDLTGDVEVLLYTIKEACGLLKVGRTYFNEEVKRGRITLVKLGRARRVTRAELLRYVNSLPVTQPGSCMLAAGKSQNRQ